MKVYFEQNFRDNRENGPSGVPQKTDWRFIYDGQEYLIPMIYYFQEGLTLDIIFLLDPVKIEKFHENSRILDGNRSAEEILCMESNRPNWEFPLQEIYINNELAVGWRCSSTIHLSENDFSETNDDLMEIQKEYDILRDQDISFQCIRVHVKFVQESQRKIHMLKFTTSKKEILLPVKKHFWINTEMPEINCEVDFIHPLTGMRYQIYINNVEKFNARERFPQYKENYPFYFSAVTYELEPPLPKDERIFLMEIGMPEEVPEEYKDNNIIGGASGVGVIGNNDENELGKHGFPLETVFTKMHWNPLRKIEMSIVGIYKVKCEAEEIMVYQTS